MSGCFSPRTRCLCIAATNILLLLARSTTAFSSLNSIGSVGASYIGPGSIATKRSTLLSSSNENEEQTTTRRFWLGRTAAVAAILLPSSAAWADYGQATSMAAPAVVPSPIRPTGEMAKTCEVVALGREDVCLVPLKLPSAYDRVLIERALDKLGDDSGDVERMKVVALLRSLAVADWEACERELSPKIVEGIPKATLKVLRTSCQKKDAPIAIKTVLKLAEKL